MSRKERNSRRSYAAIRARRRQKKEGFTVEDARVPGHLLGRTRADIESLVSAGMLEECSEGRWRLTDRGARLSSELLTDRGADFVFGPENS
jgi:hypothetical protein